MFSLLSFSHLRRFSTKANILKDVMVVDMSRVLAGPIASMMLGDLGANVIKIEPIIGDYTRSYGPPFINEQSAYFLCCNRNKKSIVIDIQQRDGLNLIKQLISKADVFLHNAMTSSIVKYGLDYETLSTKYPSLIYCAVSGYGKSGPSAHRPGVDLIAAAEGGLMSITGEPDGPPTRVGVAITDQITGLFACNGILSALYARALNGRGGEVHLSLLSAQVATLANVASSYLNCGVEARRFGGAHPSIVPYQVFLTSDGYIVVGAFNNSGFKELCEVIGLTELVSDDRFKTNRDRVENKSVLIEKMNEIFIQKPQSHWMAIFENTKVLHSQINNMQQVFEHPQIVHDKLVKTLHHTDVGDVKIVGPPVQYSNIMNEIRSPPPTLGEHTDSILKELLGLSATDINDLRERKVIH